MFAQFYRIYIFTNLYEIFALNEFTNLHSCESIFIFLNELANLYFMWINEFINLFRYLYFCIRVKFTNLHFDIFTNIKEYDRNDESFILLNTASPFPPFLDSFYIFYSKILNWWNLITYNWGNLIMDINLERKISKNSRIAFAISITWYLIL